MAAAIKTAKETGQLKSETADSTYKFIEIVNNVFEALNSKQLHNKNPQKNALSKKSTLVEENK